MNNTAQPCKHFWVNPLIARTFYRRERIETWGRGTLKIAELMRETGQKPPNVVSKDEIVTVIFHRPDTDHTAQSESRPESRPESQELANRVLEILRQGENSKAEISRKLGQKSVSGQLNLVIRRLLEQRLIKPTILDKPNSRLQKYRLALGDMEQNLKKEKNDVIASAARQSTHRLRHSGAGRNPAPLSTGAFDKTTTSPRPSLY